MSVDPEGFSCWGISLTHLSFSTWNEICLFAVEETVSMLSDWVIFAVDQRFKGEAAVSLSAAPPCLFYLNVGERAQLTCR